MGDHRAARVQANSVLLIEGAPTARPARAHRFVSFALETIDAIAAGDRLTAKVKFQDANTLVTQQGQLIHVRRLIIANGCTPVLPTVLKGLGAGLQVIERCMACGPDA